MSVFVKEMQSHPVSVFGAVEKPGVFQIRGAKTLIELLSMAQGLADDVGDTVIVMRHGGLATSAAAGSPDPPATATVDPPADSAKPRPSRPATGAAAEDESVKINRKDLLDSGDPRYNVLVHADDGAKVERAGIVYIVDEGHKPGDSCSR